MLTPIPKLWGSSPSWSHRNSFLFPVSLGHFWESGVVDSHQLKDKLDQVGLLWPPCQGASPATASGAVATLENLLCELWELPPHPVHPLQGRGVYVLCGACIGWGVGSERRTTPFPNQCLKSVMNSIPLISLPDLNLCWSPKQVPWGWIEEKERLTYFSPPSQCPIHFISLITEEQILTEHCSVLNVKCSSLPVSVSVSHSAPPTEDWNLPHPLELGLACDWPCSAEWSRSDGVSVPTLHLERPEHFHSLLAPQHTLEQSGLGFRLRKTRLSSKPVTHPAEPKRTALPRSADVWRWPAFAWVGPRRTKELLN